MGSRYMMAQTIFPGYSLFSPLAEVFALDGNFLRIGDSQRSRNFGRRLMLLEECYEALTLPEYML